MENKLVRAMLFGAGGCLVGLTMGVAAFGGAINGAVVFGPIGFCLGWLLPSRAGAKDELNVDEPVATADSVSPDELPLGDLARVEKSINEIIPIAGRMLVAVWNMQMRLLVAVGVMPLFQRHPWALFGIAFLLLALVFPLGVVYVGTGIAAMRFSATAEKKFIVDLDRGAG